MKDIKIFGEEPAFYVGVVEAVLTVLLSFGLFDLNQTKVGVIVALVNAGLGFVVAYCTSNGALSALVGLSKAVLVLAVTFGLKLSNDQTASLIAVVVLFGGAFLRSRTNSVNTAISSASPGAKKEALELFALAAAPPPAPSAT